MSFCVSFPSSYLTHSPCSTLSSRSNIQHLIVCAYFFLKSNPDAPRHGRRELEQATKSKEKKTSEFRSMLSKKKVTRTANLPHTTPLAMA